MLLSPLFYRYYCTWELHAFTIVVYGNVCTRGTLDWKVLCFCGTLGNGTFRMYPLGRFPTHPFRVLGLAALGNTKGEFISCKYQGRTA